MTIRVSRKTDKACVKQARNKRLLGVSAAVSLIAGSVGAQAQCTETFSVFANVGGVPFPAQKLTPLGTGSSLSALTSMINTVNTAFLTTTSAFVSAPPGAQPDQIGSGAWGRAIGGSVDTKSSSTGTLDLSKLPIGPFPVVTGTQNCNTKAHQVYGGAQFGYDIGKLKLGGSETNFHLGITGGYLAARTRDTTSAGSFTNLGNLFPTAAGSLDASTQVPFVGLYAAYTQGGFFLDGQARFDAYSSSLNDVNNNVTGQKLEARGISLTTNTGYNMPLGSSGWFIEPSGGVVLSRVNVGTFIAPGVPSGASFYAKGPVQVNDIDSVLGRASLRIGTSISSGGIRWSPFVTASVFHEFAGRVTETATNIGTNNGNIENAALTLTSTGGVGTYGQLGVGVSAVLGDSGWLGYVRGDYRHGNQLDGYSVNAGLRYQFFPGFYGTK